MPFEGPPALARKRATEKRTRSLRLASEWRTSETRPSDAAEARANWTAGERTRHARAPGVPHERRIRRRDDEGDTGSCRPNRAQERHASAIRRASAAARPGRPQTRFLRRQRVAVSPQAISRARQQKVSGQGSGTCSR